MVALLGPVGLIHSTGGILRALRSTKTPFALLLLAPAALLLLLLHALGNDRISVLTMKPLHVSAKFYLLLWEAVGHILIGCAPSNEKQEEMLLALELLPVFRRITTPAVALTLAPVTPTATPLVVVGCRTPASFSLFFGGSVGVNTVTTVSWGRVDSQSTSASSTS